MMFSKILLSVVLFVSLPFFAFSQGDKSLTLWYKKEAKVFEEALPLGNGSLGAMVYGGVQSEHLLLNEQTLWAGGPVNPNMNPTAHTFLPKVREALFKEDYKSADSLMHFMQGSFSESYAPMGDLYIDFDHTGGVQNYRRELDLRNAVARVTYNAGGTAYSRETFVSHPDKVAVISFAAKGADKMNVTLRLTSQLKSLVSATGKDLVLKGNAPAHAEPSYRGNMPDAIVYNDKAGMRFYTLARITKTDGIVTVSGNNLRVKNASYIQVILSAATSYNGFDKDPLTNGKDEAAIARKNVQAASSKSVDLLRMDHLKDFRRLFNRVSLNLGANPDTERDTDARLRAFTEGSNDQALVALYFQYARYLMIASSRPGGLPANLQGIWNHQMRPPWSSNYTTNINAEMNYWLSEVGNLSETHKPLLDFIGSLARTGTVTAKNYYGANGWVLHHNSDIWAMTNPAGGFGKGDPVWANWATGSAWLSTHLWEHYAYTLDKDYLRNQAYDIMKGAVQFFLHFLVKDKKGYLVTAPSTSPENIYITSQGYNGATMYGGTADLAMIRELFNDYLKAAKVLNVDPALQQKVNSALSGLYPYQIGKKGNLQEWYHDWEDQDPHHRHVSHLFGVYPGYSITTQATPALADAVKRSLQLRTNNGTGWSIAWKIGLWARLQNGEMAYDAIKKILHYNGTDGEVKMSGGGTYPNLFDAHPPFQIDGNFGAAAGIAEMLLQSHQGFIELLPALPVEWPNGSVKGLVARGGVVVDIAWANGRIENVSLISNIPQKIRIKYEGIIKEVQLLKAKRVSLKKNQIILNAK